MKQRKKRLGVLLIVAVLLMGLAGYFYYSEFPYDNTKEREDSNAVITTEEGNIAEVTENKIFENTATTTETVSTDNVTTTMEQKKELPKDYVWDTERLGEPPQIVYDFAENQERFDYIVEKVDSIVGEEDGFSTGLKYKGVYYDSNYKGIEKKLTKKFEKKVIHILENTNFYELTKKVGGDWIMYYNQEEDREHFIYIMVYKPGMTDEQAYEEDFHRVVEDWFFGTIWKI